MFFFSDNMLTLIQGNSLSRWSFGLGCKPISSLMQLVKEYNLLRIHPLILYFPTPAEEIILMDSWNLLMSVIVNHSIMWDGERWGPAKTF